MKENKKEFNFWQDHSDHYLEMAYRTDRIERVEKPDGYGKRKGQCGDTIEIFLGVDENIIRSVSFIADGCLNTRACANTVAVLADGKPIDQAWEITHEHIIEYLETLPSHETHCAELAVGAFYRALSDYSEEKKDNR